MVAAIYVKEATHISCRVMFGFLFCLTLNKNQCKQNKNFAYYLVRRGILARNGY